MARTLGPNDPERIPLILPFGEGPALSKTSVDAHGVWGGNPPTPTTKPVGEVLNYSDLFVMLLSFFLNDNFILNK